jgi:hypothetical protein
VPPRRAGLEGLGSAVDIPSTLKNATSALAVGFAIVLTVVMAAAANGRPERIKFNSADQAAARTATLHRSDLAPAGGWSGGVKKPDLSGPPSCPNYPVDLSKFVLTGVAETEWLRGGLDVNSATDVLQSARMVQAEWQIQVRAPGAVACLRSYTAKSIAAQGGKLVSFKRIAFPHIDHYTAAFRLVITLPVQGTKVRATQETVLFGRSRTATTLSVTGVLGARSAIHAAAVRYARILDRRIRA